MRITKKLLAVLLSVAMLFGATAAMTFGQNADAADAWTGKIEITDSTGAKIAEIGASEIQAAVAVTVSKEDPWTYKQGDTTKTASGTFYPLKGVLETAGVDISQAHGLRGTASDFLGGFSAEELDKLYVFEMSEVTRDGKTGTPGTFGTAINGSAGNKWITEIQSLGVANDHVIFRNKKGCQHYCAICNEYEEPSFTVKAGTSEVTVHDCEIKAADKEVVPATEGEQWTNQKGNKYDGTFYKLSKILENAQIDCSECHGFVTRASDGFTNGFSGNEIDQTYIYDMSEVNKNGQVAGKKGEYGTALNGGAGNKWANGFVFLEVVQSHVMFCKAPDGSPKGTPAVCRHYCAICGADEDTVVDPAVAPAVGKEGKTAGSHYLCGAVKDEQKVVPALKAQPMTVKAKTAKVKAKKLKKKAQKLAVTKIMTIKNAQGTKSFKITKVNKKKFKKYFKINAKSGQLTIKKKLKKGTYKVTAQISAAGNATYGAGSKTVTFKIKVK